MCIVLDIGEIKNLQDVQVHNLYRNIWWPMLKVFCHMVEFCKGRPLADIYE